jgi:hypothetical protein
MYDLDAGRIFWKEWRAQRTFWLTLVVLSLGLEIFFLVLPSSWRPSESLDQLRIYHGLVIVLACSFATGSAAIAFAGEVEAKTKGLLQRIPLRTGDLLAGKLFLALAGSYSLLFILWAAGRLILVQTEPARSRALARDMAEEFSGFSALLLAPFAFVVVGSLFSLVLGDVLLTAILSGIATVALLAVPVIHDHLALQWASIAVVAACDFVLVRRWLQETGPVEWRLPRVTWGDVPLPSLQRTMAKTRLSEWRRSGIAWRRAAGSLLWKEFRQAFPFCVKLLLAGILAIAVAWIATERRGPTDYAPIVANLALMLVAVTPLLPGVAAIWADRRGRAFGFLTDRGISADGFYLCKQLVWLGLSLAVFAVVLLMDRAWMADFSQFRDESLWGAAAAVAHPAGPENPTLEQARTSFFGPLGAAAVYVTLLYALGFLLGILVPGPVVAFFAGTFVLVGCLIGIAIFSRLQIPLGWTFGPLPLIFLFAAWVRAPDWLVGRNSLSAWGKVAAALGVPLAAILAAIAIFRVTQIPAVEIPAAVLELSNASAAPRGEPGSPFAAAERALTGGPPHRLEFSETIMAEGWQFASLDYRDWVQQNARATRLALEAARQLGWRPSPGGDEFADPSALFSNLEKKWSLTQLLLFSARQFEFEGRLDDALSCYMTVTRLRSSPDLALEWMPHWAADPKQTTDRVKRAIHEFEPLQQDAARFSGQIVRTWRDDRKLLHAILWNGSNSNVTAQSVSELWWMRWLLPWELLRLERLDDAAHAFNLHQVEIVERELKTQGFVTMTAARVASWGPGAIPAKYWKTTLEPPGLIVTPLMGPEWYVNVVATERMRLLAVALADFQREHKQLPESLQELVPTYFERLPLDPWNGRDFLYAPIGLGSDAYFKTGRIGRLTPFLGSAGIWDSHFVRRSDTPIVTARSTQPGPTTSASARTRETPGSVSGEIVNRFGPPRANHLERLDFSGPAVELFRDQNGHHLNQTDKKNLTK